MRKLSLIILNLIAIVALFSTPIAAKVYQVAPDLLRDVKLNKTQFKANPSADTAFDLAMSYAYTGQIEKGWDTLKKVPDFDKDFAPKVIQKYAALEKTNPGEWKYPFKLAFGYYFLNQKEKSIECFRRVLAIDSKNVWAKGFIALILGDLGKIDDAVSMAKDANRQEPNSAALHFLLGAGYLKQGNYWGLAQETVVVGRLKAQESIVYGEY